jgi:hypothetical protein
MQEANQNITLKNLAASYLGVSGGVNIIAGNKPLMIVKMLKDRKTITEGGTRKLP